MRVKNLLKSAAHQHKDPHVRLAHVRELDPDAEESGEVLAAMARADEDETVRLAAIERLSDLAVLRELLDADEERSRDAAERRLVARLEAGEVSDVAVRALLETHAARLGVPIASSSPVPAQREAALSALGDETAVLTVVQGSRLHDARLAAATRLTRHDTIRAALVACRSRDKVVAKLLQQRLDDEAAAEAERIATRHAVTSTLGAMETLAESVWSPQHGGRARALRERWAALPAEDTAASSAAFDAADARVRAAFEAHERERSSDVVRDDDAASADASAVTPGATAEASERADVAAAPDGTVPETTTAAAGDGAPADSAASEESPAAAAAPPVPPDAASVALAERLRSLGIGEVTAAVDAPDGDGGTPAAGAPAEDDAADTVGAGTAPLSEALRAHARAVAVLFDPPFDHQRARPAALGQRIRRVEALLDTDALLPGLDLSGHRYVRELDEHRAALVERLGKSIQESSDRVKATHRQFAALGGLSGEGKWAPANSLLKRLQKKLAAMEPAERAGLDDKLARAERQLAEMGDWQDFAARPKLEALCAEMEALPARELTVPKLSKEVRELQAQWKALGPSRAANELWPRFKTAGDAAYEPCKAYFAARGEERKAKLDARRALCEGLEADVGMLGGALVTEVPERASESASGAAPEVTSEPVSETDPSATPAADASGATDVAGGEEVPAADSANTAADGATDAQAAPPGEAAADESATPDGADDTPADAEGAAASGPEPDWKAVQRRVSDAKREWSANRVTDRKPDRALEARFSAALKPYERALSTRYAANEAEKKALIEKAAALAEGEITQHDANRAKSLLAAWKQVGMVPRRVDQKLWETFNGHLGTVFKQRQAVVREQRRAGLEHVDRARAIARELRALAKGDSVDEALVQALNDEFNALPDFPERDRRGLERDFRAALDATGRVQENAGKRRRQAEGEERRRLVELCERVETALESGTHDAAALAALAEETRDAWEASETRVAREMATRLEARRDAALAHLAAGTGFDLAANEERRRDLLIRMEVAADVETPPEDKGRRMRYQLENLQSGMTSAAVADRRATLAALEEDWLAAPPASRAVHDALHSRYLRALGR